MKVLTMIAIWLHCHVTCSIPSLVIIPPSVESVNIPCVCRRLTYTCRIDEFVYATTSKRLRSRLLNKESGGYFVTISLRGFCVNTAIATKRNRTERIRLEAGNKRLPPQLPDGVVRCDFAGQDRYGNAGGTVGPLSRLQDVGNQRSAQ